MGINRVVTSNTQGNPTDTIYGGGIGDDGNGVSTVNESGINTIFTNPTAAPNASTNHVPLTVGTVITATDVEIEQQHLNDVIQNTQVQNTIAQQANNTVTTKTTVSNIPRTTVVATKPDVIKDTHIAPIAVVNRDYTIYYILGGLVIIGIASYLILKK